MPALQKSTGRGKKVTVAAECLDSLSVLRQMMTKRHWPDNVPPAPTGYAKDNIVYYVAGFCGHVLHAELERNWFMSVIQRFEIG
jgi:hypothetical protein